MAGLPPLTWDTTLYDLAPTTPTRSPPASRCGTPTSRGWLALPWMSNWRSMGENLISGSNMNGWGAEDQWMMSPPHRANILNPCFNHIGVGVKVDGAGRAWIVARVRSQVAAPTRHRRGRVPALPPMATGPVLPAGPFASSSTSPPRPTPWLVASRRAAGPGGHVGRRHPHDTTDTDPPSRARTTALAGAAGRRRACSASPSGRGGCTRAASVHAVAPAAGVLLAALLLLVAHAGGRCRCSRAVARGGRRRRAARRARGARGRRCARDRRSPRSRPRFCCAGTRAAPSASPGCVSCARSSPPPRSVASLGAALAHSRRSPSLDDRPPMRCGASRGRPRSRSRSAWCWCRWRS